MGHGFLDGQALAGALVFGDAVQVLRPVGVQRVGDQALSIVGHAAPRGVGGFLEPPRGLLVEVQREFAVGQPPMATAPRS